MPLTNSECSRLFEGLIARGWYWDGDSIYAPHATMWLSRAHPWMEDLQDFHERIEARLQRNLKAGWMYEKQTDYQKVVDDTRGLVEVLAEMRGDGK